MAADEMAHLRHLLTRLRAKACEDNLFRQALLSDPQTTLKGWAGSPLPDGIGICVLEETPTVLFLVIPADLSERSEVREYLEEETAEWMRRVDHLPHLQEEARHHETVSPNLYRIL